MKENAKRRPGLLALLALTLILLLSTACERNEVACVVKVGGVLSLTGEFGEQGQEQLRGYQMAVEQMNDNGKGNVKLEWVWRDDQSDPHKAAIAAKELIEQCGVSILLGATTSRTTIPVAGVAEVYKVPFLIPSATSDLITSQGYNWVFRICAPSKEFASQAFDFIQDRWDVATMAIVYEDSDFGNATAVAAATQATKRGIRVVAYEVYERGREDKTREMLARVKNQEPYALFFAINYPDDAATLMRLCKCEGLEPELYIAGEGGFADPQFLLEDANRLAEDALVITQWDDSVTWNGACRFVAAYRDRYNYDIGPVSMLSAEAYAAIHVAYEAVEQAAYKDGRLTRPPTPTVQECSAVLTPEACTPIPVPMSEACTPVSIPREPIPTAIPMSTPTCTSERGIGHDRCPETKAIREQLHKIGVETAFETIFGPVRFDGAGQNEHTVLITQIDPCGRFEIIGPPGHEAKN